MALTLREFAERLASDRDSPRREPRVDTVPMPDDAYFDDLGREIDIRPLGLPRRTLRPVHHLD